MADTTTLDSAQKIIDFIASAPKRTPVRVLVAEKDGEHVDYGSAEVYGTPEGRIVFGDWSELGALLDSQAA